ncbi:hypothetical protein [Mycobacterium dioxanotrophicus]|jgi:hypothetical protein|uniref:hypothetical protein n=1 Tax=Mycobacterium dioxanotrophicus TaxID=482462 RepID=UPI0018DF4101|nr:hypothetical protein [Mycobacterium dioxanotrophicus]
MRWFARPENDALQLRVAPRLAAWDAAAHPDQVRLREYLIDTEDLLAASKVPGPWTLRLDVGRRADRDLLDQADLDNYAYPLAKRLLDGELVSVWCTKEHAAHSYVRVDSAREVIGPADVLVVETTASWESRRGGSPAQKQIMAGVADAQALPTSQPVRLELSFVVGPQRIWPNLWKQTIDSLDSILGRTDPGRSSHPLDGRITELGLHVEVDPRAGNKVVIGIHAAPGGMHVSPRGRVLVGDAVLIDQPSSGARGANGSASVDDSAQADVRPGAAAVFGNAREFRDDDDGYLAWIADHPDGYVINIVRGHTPAGARIHRASCWTVSRPGPRAASWTEGQYVKICADRLADLEHWAATVLPGPIETCGTCRPASTSRT